MIIAPQLGRESICVGLSRNDKLVFHIVTVDRFRPIAMGPALWLKYSTSAGLDMSLSSGRWLFVRAMLIISWSDESLSFGQNVR